MSGSGATVLTNVGSWILDPASSSVRFANTKFWGRVTVEGDFTDLRGSGEIGPDGSVTGSLTIAATSLDTKHGRRDARLRSAAFLDVATHPAIVFAARRAEATPTGVTIVGELTVRGVTVPLTVSGELSEATADAATVVATATVRRTDFGITWGPFGTVGTLTTVSVTARFVRSPA